tara:strand:+ start:682 stop:924 length:243 start_codon:yes stop_codon:yes gene_type:complete
MKPQRKTGRTIAARSARPTSDPAVTTIFEKAMSIFMVLNEPKLRSDLEKFSREDDRPASDFFVTKNGRASFDTDRLLGRN